MEPPYFNMELGGEVKEAANEILDSNLGLITIAIIGLAVLLVPLYFFAAGASTSRRNEPEPRQEPPIDLTPSRSPAPATVATTAPASASDIAPPASPPPDAPDADAIAAAETEAAAATPPTQEELDELAEAERILQEGSNGQ